MVGETCWPDFEHRVSLKYNFRMGTCAQSVLISKLVLPTVNGSIRCLPHVEGVCVLNCRPRITRFFAPHVLQRQRQRQQNARNSTPGNSRLEIEGTDPRPPRTSSIFAYSLAKRDAERQRCCKRSPQCGPPAARPQQPLALLPIPQSAMPRLPSQLPGSGVPPPNLTVSTVAAVSNA